MKRSATASFTRTQHMMRSRRNGKNCFLLSFWHCTARKTSKRSKSTIQMNKCKYAIDKNEAKRSMSTDIPIFVCIGRHRLFSFLIGNPNIAHLSARPFRFCWRCRFVSLGCLLIARRPKVNVNVIYFAFYSVNIPCYRLLIFITKKLKDFSSVAKAKFFFKFNDCSVHIKMYWLSAMWVEIFPSLFNSFFFWNIFFLTNGKGKNKSNNKTKKMILLIRQLHLIARW